MIFIDKIIAFVCIVIISWKVVLMLYLALLYVTKTLISKGFTIKLLPNPCWTKPPVAFPIRRFSNFVFINLLKTHEMATKKIYGGFKDKQIP